MASVRQRAFVYDAVSAVIVIALFLAAVAVTVGWGIALVRDWQRVSAVALVAGALLLLVCVRLERARWLRDEAIYEDFGAFARHAAEQRRMVDTLGRLFLIGGLAQGALLPKMFRDRVLPIRTAYEELQVARITGELDEDTYRTAVDELYLHAELRAKLKRAARG
jgi:hypothetical protein